MFRLNFIILFLILSTFTAFSQSVENQLSDVVADSGLLKTDFNTKSGVLTIYLPSDMTVTEPASGTVSFKKKTAGAGDISGLNELFSSYKLIVENRPVELQGNVFFIKVPINLPTGVLSVSLRNSEGKVVNRAFFPVRLTKRGNLPRQVGNPANFRLPVTSRSGRPATIKGNFDGNLTNASVSISGTQAPVLAESKKQLVFLTPSTLQGAKVLTLKEGDVEVKNPFTVLYVVKVGQEQPANYAENSDSGVRVNDTGSEILIESGNQTGEINFDASNKLNPVDQLPNAVSKPELQPNDEIAIGPNTSQFSKPLELDPNELKQLSRSGNKVYDNQDLTGLKELKQYNPQQSPPETALKSETAVPKEKMIPSTVTAQGENDKSEIKAAVDKQLSSQFIPVDPEQKQPTAQVAQTEKKVPVPVSDSAKSKTSDPKKPMMSKASAAKGQKDISEIKTMIDEQLAAQFIPLDSNQSQSTVLVKKTVKNGQAPDSKTAKAGSKSPKIFKANVANAQKMSDDDKGSTEKTSKKRQQTGVTVAQADLDEPTQQEAKAGDTEEILVEEKIQVTEEIPAEEPKKKADKKPAQEKAEPVKVTGQKEAPGKTVKSKKEIKAEDKTKEAKKPAEIKVTEKAVVADPPEAETPEMVGPQLPEKMPEKKVAADKKTDTKPVKKEADKEKVKTEKVKTKPAKEKKKVTQQKKKDGKKPADKTDEVKTSEKIEVTEDLKVKKIPETTGPEPPAKKAEKKDAVVKKSKPKDVKKDTKKKQVKKEKKLKEPAKQDKVVKKEKKEKKSTVKSKEPDLAGPKPKVIKQASIKKSEAVKKPPVKSSGKFAVQLASFKKKSEAADLVSRLQASGYDVYYKRFKVPGKGYWYRVRTGSFSTRQEAEKYNRSLNLSRFQINSSYVTPEGR